MTIRNDLAQRSQRYGGDGGLRALCASVLYVSKTFSAGKAGTGCVPAHFTSAVKLPGQNSSRLYNCTTHESRITSHEVPVTNHGGCNGTF